MIDLGLFFEKLLSEVFGCIKLHKKGINFFSLIYLRKLLKLRGKFSSTAYVSNRHCLCQILLCTNAACRTRKLTP